MTPQEELLKYCNWKTIDQAVEEAIADVELERTDEQLGLYCRFGRINRIKNKYWRFNRVTMLAGLSGHGKSYLLSMLEHDFVAPSLNSEFKYPLAILSFKYEMDAKDEVLRTVSGKMGKSYNYLLSSEWDNEELNYNKISDDELVIISNTMNNLKGLPIYYVETAGSLTGLLKTVKAFRMQNPGVKLVITLDHTLLSLKEDNESDLELQSATALTALRLRKKTHSNVILLNQLNGEIERPERRANSALHYPVKTDIHCGNQIFWACDDIFTINMPSKLGIEDYGKLKLSTKGLVHIGAIKVRRGFAGDIFFEDRLDVGKFVEIDKKGIEERKLKSGGTFDFD